MIKHIQVTQRSIVFMHNVYPRLQPARSAATAPDQKLMWLNNVYFFLFFFIASCTSSYGE